MADPDAYRRLVGRLVYVSVTRPELSYDVHTLAQFLSDPQVANWDAAIRVLRLKGSPGQGCSLVSWKTKKQPTVSCSSVEAVYRSMVVTTCELKWLKSLLTSLGVSHPSAMRLFCDS
ncbi:uncharacterized mitochondrial protein AtMg00810-like [Beta vulgaris subsp. vulgaris]|uniref:uncharacterized mitochondrial protein AtMg00810-like n=1 Tax=Beta vulgaris subsp. vulgaris TaxID=3555 RepID=UPI00203747A4|nr:uncharacterized mitochondrial protein AtMg00810-like [Beta vulgaris subsp. vulgaris]